MNTRGFHWKLARILNPDSRSRFHRNVIKVAQANVLAQVLPLLAAPLLTRLYTPSDFAAAALFASASGILLASATWRFDLSIPNASSRAQAAGLLVLGVGALIVISVLASLAFWFAGDFLSFWKGIDVLEPFLMVIPLAVIGKGLTQLLHAWFVREADLSMIGRARIAQGIANTGLSIGGGITGLGAAGLIGSAVISAGIGFGMLFERAAPARLHITRVTPTRLMQCLRRFGAQATLSTVVSITNAGGLVLLPLLLIQHYTAAEVGWFALMQRIAIAPIGVITGAVAQGFWAEAARLVKEDRSALRHLYLRSTYWLALLAVPVALLCLAGPLFVGPIFGEAEWQQAGALLSALTPMLIAQVVISPLSHLVVHRKQAWQLCWEACRILSIVTIVYLCAQWDMHISFTILSVSVVVFILYVALFIMNLTCLEKSA